MPKRTVSAADLMELKFAGDPQLSPDGRRLVLTLKVIDEDANQYWSHLWLYDREREELRQFTSGKVFDASPRWSPDCRRIAFVRTAGKGRETQIWAIPADGGEARKLTRMEEGAINGLAWSPQGDRLAFVFRPTQPHWTRAARKEREESGKSNPPRVITRLRYRFDGVGFLDERQHVWVCDAQTGEARQVTEGDFDDSAPAWSPDGARIAFLSNRGDDPEEKPYEIDLWWVSPQGGSPRKIETPPGYKGGIAWAPDGSKLAYVGYESTEEPWVPHNARVWVVSPQGGDARSLTEDLDRTVGNVTLSDSREAFSGDAAPIWSGDGETLYFPVSDRGSCQLYRVSVDGSQAAPLTEGAQDLAAASSDRDASVFGLLISTSTRPAEVYLATRGSQGSLELNRITHFNDEWLDRVEVGEPEEFWIESGEAGEERMQVWLLKPPDFDPQRRYPLLLYIHGGPHAQYGNTFFHEFQWHAARGYVVLYTNPRGSHGREETFALAIRGDWGELDYRDLMRAVDHVAGSPYVDEERLAVAGGSYGGYMTNWIIGHTGRFKCAVTDRSVVNLQSMFGTCDVAFKQDGYWAGNPWDDPEKLRQQSPLTYVANVETPTLIIHSENDLRCPIEQAEQLFTALKRLKVETVFVRYPQETSHGLSRSGPPDLRLDRLERIGQWLDRHLCRDG